MMRRFFFALFSFMLLFCGCHDRPSSGMLRKIALTELTGYANAINSLAVDCGKDRVFSGQMPEVLYRNPGWQGWKGPYLEGLAVTDGWGMPYKFEQSGSVIRIISGGPDRRIGTGDDILVIAEMPGVTNGASGSNRTPQKINL